MVSTRTGNMREKGGISCNCYWQPCPIHPLRWTPAVILGFWVSGELTGLFRKDKQLLSPCDVTQPVQVSLIRAYIPAMHFNETETSLKLKVGVLKDVINSLIPAFLRQTYPPLNSFLSHQLDRPPWSAADVPSAPLFDSNTLSWQIVLVILYWGDYVFTLDNVRSWWLRE